MKDSALKLISFFFLLLYLGMQLLCILPIDNRRQVVFLIWLAFAYMAYTPIVRRFFTSRVLSPLYLFLLIYGVLMLYRHTIVYTVSFIITFIELFSPFLMYSMIRVETRSVKKFVSITLTTFFLVNLVICYIYIYGSPTGYGLRDAENFTEYKNTFFVVYSFAIMIPFIIFNYFHNKHIGKQSSVLIRLFGFSICAVLALFVIKAQFMTGIILMIIGGLVAYFSARTKKGYAGPLIGGLVALVIFVNYSDDLIEIAEQNEVTAIASRTEELQFILSNESSEAADYSIRQKRSQNSVETFLEYPLFGVFYQMKDITEADKYGIGNHNEWLDTLARYGMTGFLLLLFIFKAIKKQRTFVGDNIHYILFGILGFLNPVFAFYLTCSVFFYLPMIGNIYFSSERAV